MARANLIGRVSESSRAKNASGNSSASDHVSRQFLDEDSQSQDKDDHNPTTTRRPRPHRCSYNLKKKLSVAEKKLRDPRTWRSFWWSCVTVLVPPPFLFAAVWLGEPSLWFLEGYGAASARLLEDETPSLDSESAGVLSGADLRFFHEHGFLLLRNAFPEQTMNALREEKILPCLLEHGFNLSDAATFLQNSYLSDPNFNREGTRVNSNHGNGEKNCIPTLDLRKEAPRLVKALDHLHGGTENWLKSGGNSYLGSVHVRFPRGLVRTEARLSSAAYWSWMKETV